MANVIMSWSDKTDILLCILPMYKIVKVIKLLKNITSEDSGIIFMTVIIYFYNYNYCCSYYQCSY